MKPDLPPLEAVMYPRTFLYSRRFVYIGYMAIIIFLLFAMAVSVIVPLFIDRGPLWTAKTEKENVHQLPPTAYKIPEIV